MDPSSSVKRQTDLTSDDELEQPNCKRPKHDVFMNYSYEDIGKQFISHLKGALSRNSFRISDHTMLPVGQDTRLQLLKAIEESEIYVVVFSRNYAFSVRSLDELLGIMECLGKFDQRNVLPVFYEVEQSDVIRQEGSLKEALQAHEANIDREKLDKWKRALRDAGQREGLVLQNGDEGKLVSDIVKQLENMQSRKELNVADHPVVMEPPSSSLQDLMDVDPLSSTIPCSFSDESRNDERKRTKIDNGSGVHSLPSKSTTMTPSTSSVVPSTPIPKSEIYVSLLSTARMAPPAAEMAPFTSNKMALSKSSRTPSTPIPTEFEQIHDTSTPEGRKELLKWARSTARTADPEERNKLLGWAYYTAEFAATPPEKRKDYLKWAHSTSSMAAPVESKRRFLKWKHFTSTMQRKSWSLQEEISKPFETALKLFQEEINQNEMALKYGCSDLKEEHMIYTCDKGKHGVYRCQNALWIWPKLRNSCAIPSFQSDGGLKLVGKKLKENFPESAMIKGRPTVNRLGFVTIKLSGKWIAKSIHKMLKDGIDTWAPKLPVERVIIDSPSECEEMHVDAYQREAIGFTLTRIIEYSKVDVIIGHGAALFCSPFEGDMFVQDVMDTMFQGGGEIQGNFTFPIDSKKVKEDLSLLWFGLCVHKADWILYLTPIPQLEYIEMCFTAAKLKWIPSDRHKPPKTSYAGYRYCTTYLEDNLFDKAKVRWVAVEQGIPGVAAKLLGYTAEAVIACVFKFAVLKKHRLALAVWVFDIDEMFKEEGNTFLYLLNTRAKIRGITDKFCIDINTLKNAPECIFEELILEKDEGWEKGEERILGFHLLEFTEALEESVLSVLPNILCEYLYDLSKKFNSYYSSVHKVGSVGETSMLLLCEATAIVMDKCFHLLGITPTSSIEDKQPNPFASQYSAAKRPMDRGSSVFRLPRPRYPPKNSRLEVFSFRTAAIKQFNPVPKGNVFGLISVADKHGLLSSDRGLHFFEPEVAHVPLFYQDWCNPVKMIDWGLVYLGNPVSSHSVPFTSSIEFRMELYVIKKKTDCHQLCNHKIELDLSNFWGEKSDSACGVLTVEGEDGPTYMFYVLLKDAVDAALEIKILTTCDRKVHGYVAAFYGDNFFNECKCLRSHKDGYMALLFLPNTSSVLTNCIIPLIRSVLAVPTKGSLIIKAYLEDKSGEVIMNGTCKFKSQLEGCSGNTIRGTDCSLEVKVDWKRDQGWSSTEERPGCDCDV